MFGRIVFTQIKMALRSKKYMFWTMAFPLLLGSLFYFSFSSIYESNKSEPIPVVIEVTDNAIDEYKVMQAFSNLDSDKMSDDLEDYYTDKATAEAMGQDFDEEAPIDEDVLDKMDDVKSYDDMKLFDLNDFPFDYLKVDKSEIDDIDQSSLPFMKVMDELEYEDGTKMIDQVKVNSHEEAEKLLEDGDIAGIITVDSMKDINLLVNGNGVKHSILSSIISEYRLQVDKAIDTINEDSDNLEKSDAIMDESTKSMEFVEAKGMAGDNKDPFISYFYNLIAMICIMGSTASLNVIVNNQANQTNTGMRFDCAPARKSYCELAQLVAVGIMQIAIIAITLTYLIFILKLNFGGDILVIYLTSFLASIIGVSLGHMVAHIGKMAADKKEAILMAIILGGGFMSGLMYGDMKIIMEQKAPWFNRINPSSVITDAFYALNVFGVGPRYYRAVTYMAIVSFVMLVIGFVLSRKSSYKSL